MSHDKEVSGVKVASSLLQLPGHYTSPTELRRINLYYLRRRFQALIQCSDDEEGTLNGKHVSFASPSSFGSSMGSDRAQAGTKREGQQSWLTYTGRKVLNHLTKSTTQLMPS
jgi:hypothetical protein